MTLDRVAIRQVLSNVIGDSRYLRVPPPPLPRVVVFLFRVLPYAYVICY